MKYLLATTNKIKIRYYEKKELYMTLSNLTKEYDKLQQKYGVKELDSIYNGGCDKNPDICFVFMNPTREILHLPRIEKD